MGLVNFLQSAHPAAGTSDGKHKNRKTGGANQLMITSLQQPIVLVNTNSSKKSDHSNSMGGNLPQIAGRRLHPM